jgi:hypothetical protein
VNSLNKELTVQNNLQAVKAPSEWRCTGKWCGGNKFHTGARDLSTSLPGL